MRSPAHRTAGILVAAMSALLASGCAGPTDFIFRFETGYDQALDVRTDGPVYPSGAPAPNAVLNVFFFTAESIAAWDDEWGLFDPPRPRPVVSGSTIEVAVGEPFQLRLDGSGQANVHFQRNADLVMAAWVFGGAESVPPGTCPQGQSAEYSTGDEPHQVPTRNATDAPVLVPFGVNC